MHYVVIGASAAGISAAETLRCLDPAADITIVSKEKDIAYSRCLTTYYISDRIDRENMNIRTAGQLAGLEARIMAGDEVTEVDSQSNTVKLAGGTAIGYDKLLVASGASAVIPDIPGINGTDVFPLRTLADAEDIISGMSKVKSAVILGDGLVSVSAAMALNAKGLKVGIVGIAPHILVTFLDSRAAHILQEKMTGVGIDLFLEQSFKEVHRDGNGRLTGVTLTGGAILDAGMAVIAVGVRPEFGFLKNTGAAGSRAVLVNEYMETGVPGIYAAGDVAQCFDPVRNAPVWNPLWPNAVEQGKYAAFNMAGHRKPYPGCTNMNSLNIAGTSVISVGITNPEAPDFQSYVICDKDAAYEKLVFQGERLVGFILLGKTEKAGVLTSLVYDGNLTPTQKENLLAGRFSYTRLSGLTP